MKTKFLLTLLLTCCLVPGLALADKDPLHCPDLSNSKDIGHWKNLTTYTQPSGHDSFVAISIPTIHVVGCSYDNSNLVLGKNYKTAEVHKDNQNKNWEGQVCTKGPNVCFYKLK